MGGYDISIREAPYQVNYGDKCGGVLIHHSWALTCAHCGKEDNFIRLGSKHQQKGSKIKVLLNRIHPNYGLEHEFDYDVQLLRIRKLDFSNRVNKIGIGGSHDGYIVVAGWGYLKEKGDYHDILQQVELEIVAMNICQQTKNPYYNHTLTDRMLCATGNRKDACQGDSGGGAISLGRVIGISSFGFGCGRSMPGVYINLSERSIRQWIRGYTGV